MAILTQVYMALLNPSTKKNPLNQSLFPLRKYENKICRYAFIYTKCSTTTQTLYHTNIICVLFAVYVSKENSAIDILNYAVMSY